MLKFLGRALLVLAAMWFFLPVVLNMIATRRFDSYYLEERVSDFLSGFAQFLARPVGGTGGDPVFVWLVILGLVVWGVVALWRKLFGSAAH